MSNTEHSDRLVMIVDDSEEIRDVLVELLVEEGYEVQESPNGLDALQQIRAGCRPAMILLDLAMPVMDGWTFCEERAKDAVLAAIPVLVLTAGRSAEALPPATSNLRKPFDVDQVLSAVRARVGPGHPLS